MAELLEDLAHEKTLAAQLDKQLDNGAATRRQNTLAMQRTTSKGSTRLRDAVVYGYIMQRHALQETVGHTLSLRSSEQPADHFTWKGHLTLCHFIDICSQKCMLLGLGRDRPCQCTPMTQMGLLILSLSLRSRDFACQWLKGIERIHPRKQ